VAALTLLKVTVILTNTAIIVANSNIDLDNLFRVGKKRKNLGAQYQTGPKSI
jgi:hypothetical protein